MAKEQKSYHWTDVAADNIIRQKGDKETYTVASGITPSGVVHIGNFREIITVDLVKRALEKKGKKVRFIYSWDDYDVFRKVPKGMPKQEELMSIVYMYSGNKPKIDERQQENPYYSNLKYWSSTPHETSSRRVWVVELEEGNVESFDMYWKCQVRAVRDHCT